MQSLNLFGLPDEMMDGDRISGDGGVNKHNHELG